MKWDLQLKQDIMLNRNVNWWIVVVLGFVFWWDQYSVFFFFFFFFLKWECVYLIVWLFVNFLKIDKLQSTFHQWESKSGAAEQGHLTKEVLAGCESIEWQVDLLCAYAESMTEWIIVRWAFSFFEHVLAISCMNSELLDFRHALWWLLVLQYLVISWLEGLEWFRLTL